MNARTGADLLAQALGIDVDISETDPAALERRAHSLQQEALRLLDRANRIRGDRSREMRRLVDEYMARPRSPLERVSGSFSNPAVNKPG